MKDGELLYCAHLPLFPGLGYRFDVPELCKVRLL
jgi:hypothetical protein